MGSNIGEREANLRVGLRALRGLLDDVRVSSVYETRPVHLADQPSFLNACCVGRTRLTPRQTLAELKHVEKLAGRTRGGLRYGPRVLDLDLLLYDERYLREPDLVVPHPRLRERAFVLIPLREIAADWRVPGDERDPAPSVRELAAAVDPDGVTRTALQLGDDR